MFRRLYTQLPHRCAAVAATSTTTTSRPSQQHQARYYASGGDKDPYKVLGVSRSASADEIKKAYRKLAMQKHPDQGGKSEEFAEINQAYEILGDAQKRQQYDQFGSAGMGGGGFPGGGAGGRDPNDIFNEFFRGFGGGGGGRAAPERQGPPVTDDLAATLDVSLEELYNAKARELRFNRPTVCATCQGNGSTKPGAKKQCTRCNGAGQEMLTQQVGPGMVQQFMTTCRVCSGSGTSMRPEDACSSCRGKGYSSQPATVRINLNSNVFGGDVLLMSGEAGCLPGAVPGNLHVQINQRPHPVFERKGFDLIATKEVPLAEALTGYDFTLTHLDGRRLRLKAGPQQIVNTNSVLIVRGEGMTRSPTERGNLYVFTKVRMPNVLSAEQKEKIREILNYKEPAAPENVTTTLTPDLVPVTSEELLKNKRNEWETAERLSGNGQNGNFERVSQSSYQAGGGSGRRRGRGGRGGGGGGNGAECQTM
eukprot:PhM_4_TR4882/c0_g1_i1/m.11035/K09503/DNAJA2; DnaJ homolog subfamily A member 2